MPYKKTQNHPPSKEQFHGIIEKLRQIVRLEIVKVGGTNCTSTEALNRFVDRLN